MRLFGRVLAIAMVGLVLTLMAMLGLVAHTESSRQQEVQGLRDSYLLNHLRATAENYLSTGLQLEQMQALQDVIEREQSVFDDITVIDVYSAAGVVLFSTEVGSRGSAVPAAWKTALDQATPWAQMAALQRHIGQRFDNDLGQAAGGIAITLSTVPAPLTLTQWKQHAQAAVQWVGMVALACVVLVVTIYIGIQRMLMPYADAVRYLQGRGVNTSAEKGRDGVQAHVQVLHVQRQAEIARAQDAVKQLEALDHAA